MEGFQALTAKTHTEQGIWWLNGFWKEAESYAESVWEQVHLAIELESGKPKMYGSKVWEVKEGCDLDEFKSHNFLEKLGDVMTVKQLRAHLKELDIDNNNRMSLSEYFLGKYKKTPSDLVSSPQGGEAEAEKLEAAAKAVEVAGAALREATAQEESSLAAAKLAKEALDASNKAATELKEAVAALEAEEKALADKKAGFQKKIDDPNMSSMKQNMAKNELAQLNSEDPLPLRKAQITQKAALKKAEKAAKLAAAEKEKADAAAEAAAASKAKAVEAFEEAEKALEDLKKNGDGVARGAVWWLERELTERRKYMPRKK